MAKRKPIDNRRGKGGQRGSLPPGVERKPDVSKNADVSQLDEVLQRQRLKEKNLFPLRINSTTVVYVTKDKCNAEYKEKYLSRLNRI